MPIEPKSTIELKPCGLRVMLIDIQKDLKLGDLFEAVMHLKHSSKIKLTVIVQDVRTMNIKH